MSKSSFHGTYPLVASRQKFVGRLALGAALGMVFVATSADALNIGHARLLSAPGEPLVITVPVADLSPSERDSLRAVPASLDQWQQAGLVPPVDLASLQVKIGPDAVSKARSLLTISSGQAFTGSLADLLLDISTSGSRQRYQVSLLAREQKSQAIERATLGAPATAQLGELGDASINVRSGDNMFRIARRHAVAGVTQYQLIMALQRANPSAFIRQNINLVRAGAELQMPSAAELLAISDSEARRQFIYQTRALYGTDAALPPDLVADAAALVVEQTTSGVAQAPAPAPAPVAHAPAPGADRLRLSEIKQPVAADSSSDVVVAREHAVQETKARIGQLEDNVHNLNKALQAQGEAASNAALDGVQTIGDSLQQIVDAIKEASQDAAEQAEEETNERALAENGTQTGQPSAGSAAANAGQGGAGHGGAGHGGTGQGGARQGSSEQNGAGQGSASQGGASQDGSDQGGANQGDASQGGSDQGSTGQGGASQVGSDQGGASQGGSDQGGANQGDASQGGSDQGSTGQGGTSQSSAAQSGSAGSSTGAPAGTTAPAASAAPAASGGTSAGSNAGSSVQASAGASASQAALQPAGSQKSWVQQNLLWLVAGVLGLIVLLVAWVLWRANRRHDASLEGLAEAEAKVREKLSGIDLDLGSSKRH